MKEWRIPAFATGILLLIFIILLSLPETTLEEKYGIPLVEERIGHQETIILLNPENGLYTALGLTYAHTDLISPAVESFQHNDWEAVKEWLSDHPQYPFSICDEPLEVAVTDVDHDNNTSRVFTSTISVPRGSITTRHTIRIYHQMDGYFAVITSRDTDPSGQSTHRKIHFARFFDTEQAAQKYCGAIPGYVDWFLQQQAKSGK